MIILRLDVGQEVETNISHHAFNSASRTFRMLSMEDKKQVAVPLTEPWIAYERGTENLGLFFRHACMSYTRDARHAYAGNNGACAEAKSVEEHHRP
jgi:hypothetical protein